MNWAVRAAVLAVLATVTRVFAQTVPPTPSPLEVGVEERLGAQIPMELAFMDETGARFVLRDGIKKPTLILLGFYHCPVACNLMLASLTDCMKSMPLAAGKDYQVLTISFDDEDASKLGQERKANYLPNLGPAFPADQWRFLTGDAESIRRLTEAVGYRFKKEDTHAFVHPNVLIVISPDGRVMRYVYGPDFQPFVVAMAVTEASRGHSGPSIRKMLSYCFSYDPKGKRYVLDTMRIAGFSIMIGVGLFVVFLTRRRKPRGASP